jgi:hypothetical protein
VLALLDMPVQEETSQGRLALTGRAWTRSSIRRKDRPCIAARPVRPRPAAGGELGQRRSRQQASVVLTNVMGPRHTVHFGGVAVDRLMFCVPHPGDQLGMGISILSYAGAATLTLLADARLVLDPHAITQAFERVSSMPCAVRYLRHGHCDSAGRSLRAD